MSNQTFQNQSDPQATYFLRQKSAKYVNFENRTSAPLAFLDGTGMLYEMEDKLYFNGTPISDENQDPTLVYVDMNGTVGARGTINDPCLTIADALAKYPAGGFFTVLVTGAYYLEQIASIPLFTVIGTTAQGPNFHCFLAGVTNVCDDTWNLAPSPLPLGLNFGALNGVVTFGNINFDASLYTTQSPAQLDIISSLIFGGLTANDDTSVSRVFLSGSLICSTLSLTNVHFTSNNCLWGFQNIVSGNLSLTHNSDKDMDVIIQGASMDVPGVFDIQADSLTNVLSVRIDGDFRSTTLNINSVAGLGALILYLDDVPNIVWAPGTQALTTVVYTKQSNMVGYVPTVPGDWVIQPAQVMQALDILAQYKGDVYGPAVATDNAICRFDTTSGKLIQNSLVTMDDLGTMTIPESAFTVMKNSIGKFISYDSVKANTAVGQRSQNGAPSSTENTSMGTSALLALSSGGGNTCCGSASGFGVSSGSNNTFCGKNSGLTITTGSSNIMVGLADSSVATDSNVINISNTQSTFGSAAIKIGDQATHTRCNIGGIYGTNVHATETLGVRVDSSGKMHSSTDGTVAEICFNNYTVSYIPNLVVATPFKLVPTTTLVTNDAYYITSPSAGVLQWNNANGVYCQITVSVGAKGVAAPPTTIDFIIYKNAAPITNGTFRMDLNTTDSDIGSITKIVQLNSGDQISIYALNSVNSNDVDIGFLNICLRSAYQ